MKTFITLLFAIGNTLFIQAQNQNPACLDKITKIDSLVIAGNLSDAYQPWSEIRLKCADASNKLYESGEAILKYRIELAPAADKEKVGRELIQMYDDQTTYFPAHSKANSLKKALTLRSVNGGSDEEILALLDRAFTATPDIFTDAEGLYAYFTLYFKSYQAGDKGVTLEDVMAKHDAIEAQLIRIGKEATEIQSKAYGRISSAIRRQMAATVTCADLAPYLEKNFEANKHDADWLERAASSLADKNCFSEPVFNKIAQASHALRPTETSAYNSAVAALQSGNRDRAAELFNESAQLNPNPREKASLYYTIASNVYGITNKPKAKEFADKAIAANPNMGKAYMFLAQLYANSGSECGKNEFEQKAIYWLAAEMAKKAGEVDANLKQSGSDKTAESYVKQAPTTSEIRAQKKLGKEIRFDCWINESVKVPKK